MNKFIQVGLIGGGGYLLYLWAQKQGWFGPMKAAPAAGTGAEIKGAAANGAGPTVVVTKTPAPPPDIWPKFADALKAGGYTVSSALNCDQWNYFFNQAGGVAPDPMGGCVPAQSAVQGGLNVILGTGAPDRGASVPYDVWRAWMKSKGLGRLGYTSSAYGPMFGWRSR